VILGSKNEVQRVTDYHREHAQTQQPPAAAQAA
jgi:hypothetical protein